MKLLFKTILSGFIILSLFSKTALAQSIWTKGYEETVYNQIYNSVNLNFPSDSVKKQFSNCLVQKLKSTLPDGLASIPSDTLNKLVNKMALACRTELNTAFSTKWSPEFEKVFRDYLYNRLKKTLPENIKNKLCDCFITQYKIIYPNGMPKEVPLDVENKVLGICYIKIEEKSKN